LIRHDCQGRIALEKPDDADDELLTNQVLEVEEDLLQQTWMPQVIYATCRLIP
jgi:hypothetical protein